MAAGLARRWGMRLLAAVLGLAVLIPSIEFAVWKIDPWGISHYRNMMRYSTQMVVPVLDQPRIFVHRPDTTLEFSTFTVHTDSRGLRGPERAAPKPESTRRALFLGDSVTFGWGVDLEDTFVAMAERELNAGGDAPWELVNAGHLHYDTTQELALLEELGWAYEPDFVVLVWVNNDVALTRFMWDRPAPEKASPEIQQQLDELERGNQRIARLAPYLPYTANLMRYQWGRYKGNRFRESEAFSPDYMGKIGLDLVAGWEECSAAIRSMRDAAASRGVPFAVISPGNLAQLEELCEGEAIPYFMIGPTAEEEGPGIRNSACDPHFNPRGHRILADRLTAALAELGWAD